ncbi:hypothetical protein [Kordiimonas pumila]|uniref:Lysylphosphatidylglycerol synthetase family protein n=1 Tax=Kordiimonas pumila TaxID=2161677 RepID=A0ABV7D0H6_9PROT|nr:hypothetical protein [Kordiimonas pumila]
MAMKLVQGLVVMAVIYVLIQKLAHIGWQDVQKSLPDSPVFYILFLMMYAAQPVAEWLVYQTLWGPRVKRHFAVFLRMRVYNLALVSYMGEAFLALWGKKNLGLKGRVAASAVKDSNILSALASNSFTLLMLASFFVTGQLEKITNTDPELVFYIKIVVLVGILLVPLVIFFQNRILGVDPATAKKVFTVHLLRLLAVMLLQASQWAVVLPMVPFQTWLLLLTAQMVLTRIPFLPNTDLLFMGLGIAMINYIEGPEAAIAGMFLASGALAQILNLCVFIITSVPLRKSLTPTATPSRP